MPIKLIVGLRNPGATYQYTRHNAGGWFVNALVDYDHASLKLNKKMQCEWTDLSQDYNACKVLLPTTYMNNSGTAVRSFAEFYRIAHEDILVVHDDLDLPAGRMKLKTGGGHGGHNGLRDIISHLGSSEFHRLRIGIGHPGHKELVLDYVLGKPSQNDKSLIYKAIEHGIIEIVAAIKGDIAAAMNKMNANCVKI